MAKKRRNKKKKIPPCPGPREEYVLVDAEEGPYWRKKRGSIKEAKLNAVFQSNADALKITSPAAKRIVKVLGNALRGLKTGRITLKLSHRLRRALQEDGRMHYRHLAGYDFQPGHPLDQLLLPGYSVVRTQTSISVSVQPEENPIRLHNRLVSDFYLEAFLVCGEPCENNNIFIESCISGLFSARQALVSNELTLHLPEAGIPWMFLLKVSCLEGKELAWHPKNYGMRVIGTGE